jgi:tRNA threonylcarbamoyladenosine biosynthesis protein TsaB
MKVVALDTATPLTSIAALENGELVGEMALSAPRRQSEKLLEAIRTLLATIGWAVRDAGLFVVTRGPGSFTGLRVGLGTVRGLSVATGCPAVGVSPLGAMAAALGGAGLPLMPVLEAGRGQVYAALYSGDDPPELLSGEVVTVPEDLDRLLVPGPVLVFGPATHRLRTALASPPAGSARILSWQGALAGAAGRLATRLIERGASLADLPLEARYIRSSDARLPGREA